VIVVACLLVGLPGNVRAAQRYADDQRASQQGLRRTILVLPRLPLAKELPRSLRPETEKQGYTIMVGWLLAGAASGRIPNPGDISAAETATNDLRLSVTRYFQGLVPVKRPPWSCMQLRSPVTLRMKPGQVINLTKGKFTFTPVPEPPGDVFPLVFDAPRGYPVGVVHGPITFRVSVVGQHAVLCAPRNAFAA